MAGKSGDVRSLIKLLDQQIATARSMRDALAAERRAMVLGDVDGLLGAVSQKMGLVAEMKELDQRRSEWLEAQDMGGSVLSDVAQAFPHAREELWERADRLRRELEDVAILSRANAEMLRQQLRVTRGAIDFLLSLSQVGFQYSQEGRLATSHALGGRLIDRGA